MVRSCCLGDTAFLDVVYQYLIDAGGNDGGIRWSMLSVSLGESMPGINLARPAVNHRPSTFK